MSTLSDTLSSLHPLYEIASVISLLTLRMRSRITLRSALVLAHGFYMASIVTEAGAIDREAVAWGALNLSFDALMLAELVCGRARGRPSIGCRKLLDLLGSPNFLRHHSTARAGLRRRVEALRVMNVEVWTSDKSFF